MTKTKGKNMSDNIIEAVIYRHGITYCTCTWGGALRTYVTELATSIASKACKTSGTFINMLKKYKNNTCRNVGIIFLPWILCKKQQLYQHFGCRASEQILSPPPQEKYTKNKKKSSAIKENPEMIKMMLNPAHLLQGGVCNFGETSSSALEFEITQPEKICPLST